MSIISDWTDDKAKAFGRENLVFQHGLHQRPMFDDEGLARLLDQYPRDQLGVFTMDRTGTRICTPRLPEGEMEIEPWLDFSSGYVQRALAVLPRQGAKVPWKVHQNYALDLVALRYGKVDDGTMEFSKAKAPAKARTAA